MFLYFLCAFLLHTSLSQRYAERNVLPADTFPSSNSYDYNYDYTDGYGFDEDMNNVYKWNVEEYPHPKNKSRFCNRLKPSHVCDPDSILEKDHADHLDAFIRKLYKETPCICDVCDSTDGGIVVGIALLKHMYQPYNVHPVKVIRSFAEKLRSTWGLGKCDNDILIVIATADRLWYTDVGKATSSYLSLHEAHRIFLDNKAKFSAGNFYEGLRDILQRYYEATRFMKFAETKKEEINIALVSGAIIGSIALLGILIFLAFVLCRLYRRKKSIDELDHENGERKGDYSKWSNNFKGCFKWDKQNQTSPATAKYQPCKTDDNEPRASVDEEHIDFRLATPADTSFTNTTQVTNVTSESEELEKDLVSAAEGIVKTFPSQPKQKVLITDM